MIPMNKPARVHIKFQVDGAEIEGAVDLPAPSSATNRGTNTNPPRRLLLPILQQLTDAIVSIAEQRAAENGTPVTCSKGCDACCRQMVPITTTEAHALAHLLQNLPADLAVRIRARFKKNLTALHRAGLLDKLTHRHNLPPDQLAQLDRDYFAQNLPCPFLEHRACSIHPHRPLACREFLVTSNPIHCANPASGKINQIQLGAKLSLALLATDQSPWLPLILALNESQSPEPPAPLPPADDLLHLLNSLSSAGSS